MRKDDNLRIDIHRKIFITNCTNAFIYIRVIHLIGVIRDYLALKIHYPLSIFQKEALNWQ
jgi:hypothetical protein